jgi:hypothetical protein
MLRNTIFAAAVAVLAYGLWLMQSLEFLIPYKRLILARWLPAIGWYFGLLLVNLIALLYHLNRAVFLKDTGRKLAHLERQLRSGSSLSEELSGRLEADR